MITVLIINKNSYNKFFEFKLSSDMININNIDKVLNNNNDTSKLHTWEYDKINISLYGINHDYDEFNINLHNFPDPIDKVYGNCMLIAYDTINHKYIDLSTNYYTEFVHKLFNLSTQNSIITPTYDTDFSISFDDTKINSSSVPICEEDNINIDIELDYNDNNNDTNDIIDVSDLSLTDDDNDLIDFDNNTFELTFSDEDTNNNSNNIKII